MSLKLEIKCKSSPSKKDYIFYPDSKIIELYLGKKSELTDSLLRKKISDIDWTLFDDEEMKITAKELSADQLEIAYEMVQLKSIIFDKYKTDEDEKHTPVSKVSFSLKKPKKENLEQRDVIIDAVKFCRNIVSSNASEINPAEMEKLAKSIAKKSKKLSVKVIDASKAEKLGMGCLLAVGAESLANSPAQFHPRMVVLEYTGNKYTSGKKHLGLVGKGITFDTGGLCLKPTKYMLDMRSDMAGSAAVLSVFKALSEADDVPEDIKVTGVLALTENGFGGSAYKPGDVLTACNGKTVQVVDTDAEGRLALADALAYISDLKDKPEQLIGLATLTGSIVYTLGEVAAGGMTNDEKFLDKLTQAFEKEGERIWHMPLFEEYKDKIKSSIADMAHCSSRPDALVAGMFLKEFVGKDISWTHLDIAGMGFIEEDGLWAYKGATGFGVKGLVRYILN